MNSCPHCQKPKEMPEISDTYAGDMHGFSITCECSFAKNGKYKWTDKCSVLLAYSSLEKDFVILEIICEDPYTQEFMEEDISSIGYWLHEYGLMDIEEMVEHETGLYLWEGNIKFKDSYSYEGDIDSEPVFCGKLRKIESEKELVEQTFVMIKPDAVQKGFDKKIVDLFIKNGFKVVRQERFLPTSEIAKMHYAEHVEKDFYPNLEKFITSGEVVVLQLEKHNAIKDARKLIGSTDPKDAAEGTIRKLFGESKTKNAVHGSDSNYSAFDELRIWFGDKE